MGPLTLLNQRDKNKLFFQRDLSGRGTLSFGFLKYLISETLNLGNSILLCEVLIFALVFLKQKMEYTSI
jgi:hypothetical protein